jgi:TPR repeat protein
LYWYKKLAQEGDIRSLGDIGSMYVTGDGVKQDYHKAYHYFKQCVEKKFAYCQRAMGDLYFSGYGVKRDYQKAAYWYRKAAAQKYTGGLYMLGQLYYFGKLGKPNKAKGIALIRQAAYLGDPYSQTKLGLWYYGQVIGKPHTNHDPESWMWLTLGANQGDPKAIAYLPSVTMAMQNFPDRQARARALLANYKGETIDPTADASGDKMPVLKKTS